VTVPASKPRVRPDLTIVELDGEAVIYDELSGDLHHLNSAATLVLGLCDGTATGRQLASDIAEAYGLPRERVAAEVQAALREFRKSKLLAPSEKASRSHA
jgi:PqqD family protein of HPr-rel-A system